jgi:hypothetical protein
MLVPAGPATLKRRAASLDRPSRGEQTYRVEQVPGLLNRAWNLPARGASASSSPCRLKTAIAWLGSAGPQPCSLRPRARILPPSFREPVQPIELESAIESRIHTVKIAREHSVDTCAEER